MSKPPSTTDALYPSMTKIDSPASRAHFRQAYEELMRRYPLFFRAARYPATHPCEIASNGIKCGLGWYALIDEAASSIENELRTAIETISESDVLTAIERRLKRLAPNDQAGHGETESEPCVLVPFCTNIFSNNGMLNIVITAGFVESDHTLAKIGEAVDRAYAMSLVTCENCGERARRFEPYACLQCRFVA